MYPDFGQFQTLLIVHGSLSFEFGTKVRRYTLRLRTLQKIVARIMTVRIGESRNLGRSALNGKRYSRPYSEPPIQ